MTALLPSLRPSRCDPTELARWACSDEAGLFRDGELGRSRRASCGCVVLRTHVRTRVVWWCWCSSPPFRRALLAGSRDGPARTRRAWWRTRSLEAGLLRLLRAPAKVVTSQYTEFDTKTRFRAAISPQTKPNPPRDHPDPPHSRQTRAERARSTGGDRRRPEATGGDRRRPEATGGDRRRSPRKKPAFFIQEEKITTQSAFAQQPQHQGGGGGPRGDSTRRRRYHRHCRH